jgi:DNA-binding PadR family transcriptional regulator
VKGWVTSAWRVTESGRRARYYCITRSGEARLADERASWARQVAAVDLVLRWV